MKKNNNDNTYCRYNNNLNLLYAHSGESNLANPLFVWTLDPSVVVITIFAYFYFRGLTKYRRKLNHKYPLWRAICFVAGFVFLILALCSPIDYLANSYFYFHMIQHLLVVMFAAPLLLLGLPVLPVVSGAHNYFPKFIGWMTRLKIYRSLLNLLVNPKIAIFFYLINFWLWHFPLFYDLALTYEFVHYLQHFLMFMSAVFLWYSLVAPIKKKFTYFQRLLWLGLLTIANSALSALIIFNTQAKYNYAKINQGLLLDAITDQKIGGLIMWIVGNMMFLMTLVIILFVFFKNEQKQ